MYLYVNRERFRLCGTIILCLMNYFLYVKTNSRLSFYLSLIMILICFFCGKKEDLFNNIIVKCLLVLSFFLAATISLYLTLTYDSSIEWMSNLNHLLGDRLYIGQMSVLKYGVSLFGIKGITWNGNGLTVNGELSKEAYSWVDCMYMQILQKYGVIFLVLLLIIITVCIYKLVKQKKLFLSIIFAFIALRSMIDDLSLMLFMNGFWMVFGSILSVPYASDKKSIKIK